MADSDIDVLQNAQVAADNGAPVNMLGYHRAAVLVTITATITVNFETSYDGGTTWVAVALVKAADGTLANTATASGIFYVPVGLLMQLFRARTSGPSGSPSATVRILRSAR